MKHPIYNDLSGITMNLVKALNIKNKLGVELTKIANAIGVPYLPNNDSTALITKAIITRQIMSEGHTLIKVKGEDWKSDITEKTLSKMKLKDFKFSFNSGTIIVGETEIHFAHIPKETAIKDLTTNPDIFIAKDGQKIEDMTSVLDIVVTTKSTNTTWFIQIEENDYLFEKISDSDYKNLITITMSVLFYAATFKNNSERVKSKKVTGKKNSKLKIPKHVINNINLFQTINNSNENDRNGTNWKSDKRWIVRGHLRNQYYKSTNEHKLKWIDPYWKGSGKDEVEKVYNIK